MCRVPSLSITMTVAVASLGAASSARATLPPAPNGVQTLVREGVEFSVIGAPGNAAFASDLRPSWYPVQQRGRVDYTFALARTEVTTAQWIDFVNAFSTRGGAYTQFAQPIRWGARADPTYSGPGLRWQLNPNLANAPETPVWGISWREAAMYCNWLQNGRTSDPASLTHGAYDTSTFGYPDNNFFNGFTDQVTRSPGAQFWIPNLDEWIKGAFYDQQQSKWWLSHYGSDTRPVYGYPGDPGAQSSAGLPYASGSSDYFIPLTAYGTQSPFGLLSTSGGPDEWLEDAVGVADSTGLPGYRLVYQGGGDPAFDENVDLIFRAGLSGELPGTGYSQSVRIASAIPGPGALVIILVGFGSHTRRRRGR